MAEAMVTARMSAAKKESGNAILANLGTNASQVINQMYDYILENKRLPFSVKAERHVFSEEELAHAVALVDSITTLPAGNRFSSMTDDEIKRERLAARGLFDGVAE